MDRISELPDCVLSYILSMLSVKDLLKTSILSKRWCKLWSLRRDLNFDIHNVLGSEKELLEAGYLVDVLEINPITNRRLDRSLSKREFMKRVDQFLKNFQGTKIDSFRVDFYLNRDQSSIIDQWISFAVAKGVGRIDLLLLGRPYVYGYSKRKPYKFPFGIFSESSGASTLTQMHLQNCLVWHPHPDANFDIFPIFTNLRSLVLEDAQVDETLITSLLSKSLRLVELSLLFCWFKSTLLKIVSSSLCHLKVICCLVNSQSGTRFVKLSSLDCLKLTSLDCPGFGLEALSINAPLLKTIKCSSPKFYEIPNNLALFATLPQLEILDLRTFVRIYEVETSLRSIGPFKTLKQLNLLISSGLTEEEEEEEVGFDMLWILTILRASPLLQKLSIMIADPQFSAHQKDINDFGIFPHSELKVIEMGGCVGNWYEIEFALNVLKYVYTLERIVLSPYWREDDLSDWDSDPAWFQNGRERVREKLQGQIVRRTQLILV